MAIYGNIFHKTKLTIKKPLNQPQEIGYSNQQQSYKAEKATLRIEVENRVEGAAGSDALKVNKRSREIRRQIKDDVIVKYD